MFIMMYIFCYQINKYIKWKGRAQLVQLWSEPFQPGWYRLLQAHSQSLQIIASYLFHLYTSSRTLSVSGIQVRNFTMPYYNSFLSHPILKIKYIHFSLRATERSRVKSKQQQGKVITCCVHLWVCIYTLEHAYHHTLYIFPIPWQH